MTRTTKSRGAVLTALAVTAGSVFTLSGAPSPASAEPLPQSELYVRQVFVDVLRDADPQQSTVDAAQAELAGGRTGFSWVGSLLNSDAGRLAFVSDEYERILDRPLEAGAGGQFVNLLAQGQPRTKIRSLLVGSTEYFQTHGGSTREGFIRSAYLDLLGRPASDGDVAHWIGQLDRGIKRDKIAGLFQLGAEGRQVRADVIFRTFLNRPLGTAGKIRFSARFRAGVTEQKVIAEVAGSPEYRSIAYSVPAAETAVLLTDTGNLTTRRADGTSTTAAVTGLTEGTTLVGIDIRPATGVLYGLGSNGQLYSVSAATGTAVPVGAPIPGFDASAGVGFDFNPAADKIRVVTQAQNFRLDAENGAILGEGPAGTNTPGTLQFVAGDINEGTTPVVSAAAYTNSTRGLPLPTATAIYDIDADLDIVARQNPANAGDLTTSGSLLLDATAANGFDVSPDGFQTAYAVLTAANNGQGLYRIDLTTGEPKLLEDLAGDTVVGLAIIGDQRVAPTEAAYGITADGLSLVTFSTTNPTPTATVAITGQTAGTTIVGIDIRPTTGQLFAIGSNGQLYTVNTTSGVVTRGNPFVGPIGNGTFTAEGGVAFDFNPVADAIRVVAGGKNYRVLTNGIVAGEGPPNTGLGGPTQYVAGDPGAGTTPVVSGAAYTNSFRGTTRPTATALYDIETVRNVLVRQNPANSGDLTTIGPLGLDADGVDGFDISSGPGQNAYAVLDDGGTQSLYLIDLATGQADKVGDLPQRLTALALL